MTGIEPVLEETVATNCATTAAHLQMYAIISVTR